MPPPRSGELAGQLRAAAVAARSARGSRRSHDALVTLDTLCRAAVDSGWTYHQLNQAVGAPTWEIRNRVRRARAARVVTLTAVPPIAPVVFAPRHLAADRRLVGARDAAELAGCSARSIAAWAQARDVHVEWTPDRRKRLYDADEITTAAASRPTARRQQVAAG